MNKQSDKIIKDNTRAVIEALNSDTRNDMHAILGCLELIGEGSLDPSQEKYVHLGRDIAKRHCRGVEEVSVVLGAAVEESPVLVNFAPVDLLTRVAQELETLAARKQVKISCHPGSAVPDFVLADADRIAAMLMQAVEGLVSAIDSGQVDLGLRAAPSPDGFHLTFEVCAPRRILPPALMEAVQQDNYRFDVSLSDSAAIGMAAGRKLAMGLAGRVVASSGPSVGTRVEITIPVCTPSDRTSVCQSDGQVSSQQRSLSILLAEDSEPCFDIFNAYLRREPHSLVRASNGAVAVELAATGTFDIVFMDIRMPVMDGYEATKRIRDLEKEMKLPPMPIVILSGKELRGQYRQSADLGCSGHLAKPIRKEELLESIRIHTIQQPIDPIRALATALQEIN